MLVDNNHTFIEAIITCSSLGATLAKIESKEEQEFINHSFLNNNSSDPWIGCIKSSQMESKIHWLDGSAVTFTNWGPQQPNEPKENCIHVLGKTSGDDVRGQWYDTHCSHEFPVLCEKRESFPWICIAVISLILVGLGQAAFFAYLLIIKAKITQTKEKQTHLTPTERPTVRPRKIHESNRIEEDNGNYIREVVVTLSQDQWSEDL